MGSDNCNVAETWHRGTSWLLAGWFAVISAAFVFGPAVLGNPLWFGWDAVVYTHAAQALISGGNPWATEAFGIHFAAPPTGLLPFLPFVVLPDSLVAAAWIAIGLGSSVYAVRRLSLPLWWLLFPPLVMGIAAGSSAPLVLALIVKAGFADRLFRVVREEPATAEDSTEAEPFRVIATDADRGPWNLREAGAAAAAILIRPYAALPALLLRRWRALIVAAVATVATAPFLAWPAFFDNLPAIQRALSNQANGGLSAAFSPYLILLAVVGLFALGRRRAAWLIVPALWPASQLYYASLALPVLAEMPIVALAIASPAAPGLIAFGIYAQAALERISRREMARRWSPDALLARRERRGAAPAGASARARE
jgi:hypothetical protein